MDIFRDTRKPSDFSKLLDTASVRTNPFGQNISGNHAYRRAERLAAALHLLTNHIHEREPSRVRVRELAGTMLTAVLSLKGGFRAPGGELLKDVHACIRELISLMRIQAIAGYISLQNAETMCESLDDLGHFLTAAQRSQLAEAVLFTKEELLPAHSNQESSRTKLVIKDKGFSGTNDVSMSVIKSKEQLETRSDIYRTRTHAVLDVLKRGGTLNIKDISAHFPELSEKTVQRVLVDLVKDGVVRYDGMKRWRKYSLTAHGSNVQ